MLTATAFFLSAHNYIVTKQLNCDPVGSITKSEIFFVLCSAGKFQRDVYSQIYFDVSPGNGRQASSENRTQGGKTSEAWFINSHPHVMNRSDGDSLPQVYRRLITS